MRTRRIAVLIDGGFFVKRLSRLVAPEYCDSAATVANSARVMCKNHVRRLPFSEVAHHPILNRQIQFAKTPEAQFRNDLSTCLRRQQSHTGPFVKPTPSRADSVRWHRRAA